MWEDEGLKGLRGEGVGKGWKGLEELCVNKLMCCKMLEGCFTTSKRLNLNNPTLSRRDATEGSGRRRSVGIIVRHTISVSKTRNQYIVWWKGASQPRRG